MSNQAIQVQVLLNPKQMDQVWSAMRDWDVDMNAFSSVQYRPDIMSIVFIFNGSVADQSTKLMPAMRVEPEFLK